VKRKAIRIYCHFLSP